MIVLNKKKIMLVVSVILIGFFTFTIQNRNGENTVQTVALPVTNKVIVIDARAWHSR